MSITWNNIRDSLLFTPVLAVPCLTFLAYRGQVHRPNSGMPRWRRIVGMVSILSTFLGWLLLLAPFGFMAVAKIQIPEGAMSVLVPGVPLTILIGICSAFALRGSPRLQTLLAGLLMVFLCWLTYNF
jgi:hypothetical protein